MAYDLYHGPPDDERARVTHLLDLFAQRRTERAPFEAQWEEIAALAWPEYRNTFAFGSSRTAGEKYTQFQVDSKGSIGSHRFMAIAGALLTPETMLWSKVVAADSKGRASPLMKDRAARIYFADVTKALWQHRYRPEANFVAGNQRNMQSLGVFGNMGMLVDELDTKPGGLSPGLRYTSTSVGEMYPMENHQGRIDGFIRHFRWTARQIMQRWPDKCPQQIKNALEQNSVERFDLLQFVLPRTDYDPNKVFSPQSKPWASCYVCVVGQCIMEESGYRTFPWACGRYSQAPDEIEGRGPGQMVLPSLKTLNAEKGLFLTQGHRAADPTYLLADDGLVDFKNAPGHYNYGGIGMDGQKMVDILPTGDIQVTLEMMQQEEKAVDDAFLVSLYPLLFDQNGRMKSAREVVELANDRGMFLTPLGRQNSDYIGPMVYRELDVLAYLKLLPEQPPSVKEAQGEYTLQITNPLMNALSGQPIAGFMRTVEITANVVQAGGDPALMDVFDFETALPEIAEDQFVPPRWMASAEKIAAKAKARAQSAERERQVKELPGKAAIMKAQAISDKAATGGNTGGTLSGMPEGGMPMMPGQTAPGGRAF